VNRILRARSPRRGQAAVEFALVLPILLVMLIGIVEFGRAWSEHQVITDAAREAARQAAIHDEDVVEHDVLAAAYDAMGRAGINYPARCASASPPCVVLTNWDGPTNSDLTVAINLPYRFTFFGPLVKWATGKTYMVLKTTFTMRNE
jgi:Flp pilus assembly protein TadG